MHIQNYLLKTTGGLSVYTDGRTLSLDRKDGWREAKFTADNLSDRLKGYYEKKLGVSLKLEPCGMVEVIGVL